MNDFWETMARPGAGSVTVNGRELRPRSRVRLRPHPRGDVLDAALAGETAVIEGIDEDETGLARLAVTLESDPGRVLGDARVLGHRFFFALDEVEPLDDPGARVLIAGIGNIFLGDDGFGVEVVRRLAEAPLAAGVVVEDFGIRGLDLAYALQDDWQHVILVDAAPHGATPGTVSLLEAAVPGADAAALDPHGMDPARVLALARTLGHVPAHVLIVGCQPLHCGGAEPGDDVLVALSPPVAAAVDVAVAQIRLLIEELVEVQS